MSEVENDLVYDKEFLKDARNLSRDLQMKLDKLLPIFKQNLFDSRLHTKPLSPPLQGIFSFRITRDYRVGFKFLSDHVVRLLAADRRGKIYKKLLRKK